MFCIKNMRADWEGRAPAPRLKPLRLKPARLLGGSSFSRCVAVRVFWLNPTPLRTNRCTHLICAAAGAPKHRKAHQNGGVVVSVKWLDACEAAAAKVPVKSFLVLLPPRKWSEGGSGRHFYNDRSRGARSQGAWGAYWFTTAHELL